MNSQPMEDIWKPRVVAASVIARAGQYLCVEEDIDGKRVFNQPAGHLDPGETLIDAARRETLEETAWHIRVDALLGVYLVETEQVGKTFIRFCFSATALEFDPKRELDKEIVATHWLSHDEVRARAPRLRSPLVLQAIEAYESGVRYPLDMLHAALRRT